MKKKIIKISIIIISALLLIFVGMNAFWFYGINKLLYPVIGEDMHKDTKGTYSNTVQFPTVSHSCGVYIAPYMSIFTQGWWGQMSVNPYHAVDENGSIEDYQFGLSIQPSLFGDYKYIFFIDDYTENRFYADTSLVYLDSDLNL
ncbi:MAG: hypothetical protein ACI4JX_04895, partial [Oscillospiraceae bacterium]